MAVKSEVELLRQVPLFAAVEAAQLQLLAFNSRKHQIAAGEFLVKAEDAASAAHLILNGEAQALDGTDDDAKVTAYLSRGAFIGELSMVANLPAAVTVRAVTTLQVMAISSDLFQRVCTEFPEDGARMLASLGARLDGGLKDLLEVRAVLEQAEPFSRTERR